MGESEAALRSLRRWMIVSAGFLLLAGCGREQEGSREFVVTYDSQDYVGYCVGVPESGLDRQVSVQAIDDRAVRGHTIVGVDPRDALAIQFEHPSCEGPPSFWWLHTPLPGLNDTEATEFIERSILSLPREGSALLIEVGADDDKSVVYTDLCLPTSTENVGKPVRHWQSDYAAAWKMEVRELRGVSPRNAIAAKFNISICAEVPANEWSVFLHTNLVDTPSEDAIRGEFGQAA